MAQVKNSAEPRCPVCKESLAHSHFDDLSVEDDADDELQSLEAYSDGLTSGSKADWLCDLFLEMAPDDKLVVFSSFTSFLDLAQDALKRVATEDMYATRIDGTMNQKRRKLAQDNFMGDPACRIIFW